MNQMLCHPLDLLMVEEQDTSILAIYMPLACFDDLASCMCFHKVLWHYICTELFLP